MIKENAINFLGKKFNKLTILEDLGVFSKSGERKVIAICECGKKGNFRLRMIRNGHTRSCGCLKLTNSTKHGLEKHPLYNVWKNMIARCYDEKSKGYKYYGQKGVLVCIEWRDIKNFYNWAINNGYEKGLQLDKDKLAPNQTGNLYCPEYCCFLTAKENLLHKRNSFVVEYNNENKSLTEWCVILGLRFHTIRKRIKEGWTVEEALNIPIRHFKKLAS